MIELKNLSAGYGGLEVIHGVSLAFTPGRVLALLGPNGCGKSTLLRTALGLNPSSGGQVLMDGVPLAALSPRERALKAAYLPQSRSTPNITAYKMVLHGRFPHLSYPRRYRKEDYEAADRALDWAEDRFSWSSLRAALDLEDCLEIRNPPGAPVECLRPGRAEGVLTGGNLSLAVHSLGTPEQIDARGRVLYLEDVGEAVYALEKMLTQLLRAGVLAEAAALVFGAFARCGNAYRPDYGPQALLQDFFAGWPCPVLAGLRSAHCSPMVTLPMGTLCQIDGDLGTITVRR